MRAWMLGLALAGLVLGGGAAALADVQEQKPPVSPRGTATGTVDGAEIEVDYGRPSMRGRKIVGELVPYGKVWRTGANEATHFTTSHDIRLGSVDVPAGKYTLYTIPGEKEWQLVVNKQTGQWGTKYDEGSDLGRTTMQRRTLDKPVEQFTITVDQKGLRMAWETTEVSVPIAVKK